MNQYMRNANENKTQQTKTDAGRSETSSQPARLARRTMLALAAVMAVGLAMADSSLAAGSADEDEVWQHVDAGSLGVSARADADYGYCLADAGSLGITHPADACDQRS